MIDSREYVNNVNNIGWRRIREKRGDSEEGWGRRGKEGEEVRRGTSAEMGNYVKDDVEKKGDEGKESRRRRGEGRRDGKEAR